MDQGARLPWLPASYPRNHKWRWAEQADLADCLEAAGMGEAVWRQNFAPVSTPSEKVLEVLTDKSLRGQVLTTSEAEARRRFTNLAIASLGAIGKDKPKRGRSHNQPDGTHDISVNRRTRTRDQEKRAMREKPGVGVRTFAMTADVSEAHRQAPVDERDWHILGCQVVPGGDVHVNTVGTLWRRIHTVGLAWPRHWDGSRNVWWAAHRIRGTCLMAWSSTSLTSPSPRQSSKSIHVLPDQRRCYVFHRVEKEVAPPPQVRTRRHPPTW